MRTLGARRWWAVGALVLAVLAVGFDVTILSLALPALATGLHASTSQLQWFVAAYTLVFAAAMIPGGMLGDRFGRKKMLLIALVIFGGSSLAAAYAPSAGAFIAARAVLGLGGAVILPMVLGVVPTLFAHEERRRAIAVVMGASMVGYPVGPILGGWLLGHFWWGAVFLINVPVVVLALLATAAWLPESRDARPRRLDVPGVIGSSAGLAALTYGVIQAGQYGWGDVTATGPLAGGAVLIACFVAWERRANEPLVDLTLFRNASFSVGTLLGTAVNFVMFGVLFAVPQYFQAVLGTDAMGGGVRLLPLIGGMLAGVAVADRFAVRAGARAVVGLGYALLAGAMFAGATTSAGSGYGLAAAWITVAGLGLGFVMPVAMDAAIGTLREEAGGVGSALIQAVRMVGGSFGAAILGSVLNSGYRGHLDLTGLPPIVVHEVRTGVYGGLEVARRTGSAALAGDVRAAFVHGMDVLLVVSASLGVLAALLGLFLPSRRPGEVGSGRSERPESEHEAV
ncbi:DHA2 family efflux MFS transporter permease subunit [Actinomadura sp. DC4]|uniref:DHA2 family efflux MFS transporter permease subunit n=1 Tax=Actinomadura sp. DC4 TaxID=3055069 RepID=UPI0025B25676|nr:DHA2 family efflux MFS transporter permease subunit [Actinomadura sp. DC4]MDN3351681.1 DHA2 family efflux MFS transporter permease subunit [Actinomadura sp. DC4]